MNVVATFKLTFTTLKKESLSRIQNKNVSVATHQLEDIAIGLNKVNTLLEGQPLNTIESLLIFSWIAFRDTLICQNTKECMRTFVSNMEEESLCWSASRPFLMKQKISTAL